VPRGASVPLPGGAVLPRAPVLYAVQPGDTLAAIAKRWGTSVPAIAELNGISNPNLLRVGQQLQIPGGAAVPRQPSLYTVQPGDTLTAIAAAFDTTVDAIVSLNGIARPNLIPVGTRLRVP
jgi:LysM repeat protein